MYQHRAAAADREGANEHAGPYFDCASQKLIATSALYADGHAAYVSPYVALPGAAVQKHGQVIGTAAYDADQAVLSPNNSGYGQNIAVTSPRSINGKRAIRVSLITSRSLYNIHEPETQTSALGLNLDGAENFAPQYASTWDYDPYLARSTESPSSAVPSLTHSSRTSSAGYSTGCSTPVARRVEVPAEQEVAAKKEKRVGKAFLGKLKSFLLAPKSPASAEREIKQATKTRQRLRRSRRAPPPAIEERSTSLYRTVDIPDPLDFAPASGNRRASVFCSGPYGDLGAYNAESTASVAFGLPQSAYASVADFRHYSTAELPFDPTVPYSPYTEARESARFSALITSPVETDCSGDLQLGTDKIKLKEKDWARRSKQFWSSALDLTLPRSNRFSTMSTAELAIPPVDRPTQGLVPAPPIPARSRLRGVPSNGNIKREAASTPRTPAAYLPASPSNSSIGSSASSGQKVHSPGVPVTPDTPGQQRAPAGQLSPHEVKADYGFGDYLANGAAAGPSGWPGKLEHSPISPMAPPANGQAKRSRFSRGSRHSSSGSVSLSASSDPLRVKDGVAPRGSSSGIYTPPTFPGPSPRPSVHGSTSSVFMPMNPAMRSASGSSEMSYSTTSSTSIPQTPTSPSAAASRMYTACVGALSGWSISGSRSKRASDPQRDAAPMSASGAYFPGHSSMNSRNSSFSQSSKHQTSRSVSYASAQEAQGPVQVWSAHGGWTGAAYQAGLGVGVEEEGNYAHGRTRSSTSATTGAAMILADAPKGRRKPVPRAEGAEEEVHAL